MADPVTVGTTIAWVMATAAETMLKGAANEVVKDAYKAVKEHLTRWLSRDLAELEKAPTSKGRQTIVAEAIDALPANDIQELRRLTEDLSAKLKAQAGPIGVDLVQLQAAEVSLGQVSVTNGVGVRISESSVSGAVTMGDISVGSERGKA